MKKTIILALALLCIIGAVGCRCKPEQPKIATTVSYAGWSDDKSISDGALNKNEINSESKDRHLPIFKMDTFSEFEQFKSDYGDVFAFDQKYNDVGSFNDVISKAQFDRKIFFKDNTLLLVYVRANSGSYRFGISAVNYDEEAVWVYVNQTNEPENISDDMAGWFIIISIPDSEVRNLTSFDAILEDDRD